MIRPCTEPDFHVILAIINEGAQAYRGVIPADRWHEPYMSTAELQNELQAGVVFWGDEQAGELIGVMGSQRVEDVTLIRHAYVRTGTQQKGVGSRLLAHLRSEAQGPVLIGTWADATWAIRFYKKHGFHVVDPMQKQQLLRK